ncbi:6279_t:CDS:1 [Paraglomus occultum]|uniref:6279_t:CDS:1 n=1 Tax=Paraglomus occultum TaxID=144539 RepID=A0A9N9GTX3_9GLOM|nr:6279_t:CDS:1 [Paraglomus occultum]
MDSYLPPNSLSNSLARRIGKSRLSNTSTPSRKSLCGGLETEGVDIDIFNIDAESFFDFEINNNINRFEEAAKIAESLHIFLSSNDINDIYIITRGSFISLTSVKNLESSLALGIGGDEVLAQLEIYGSRIKDLEKLVQEFNL